MPVPAPHVARVLIVDGEEETRTFLESALRRPGYQTTVVTNSTEAIEVARTDGPFDLLITDVVVPGMPGDELARQLRILDPALRILYLTSHSDRLFAERMSLWEEEAFLEKPVTVLGVVEAVSLLLVGHIAAPRPVRVSVPGGRVKIADGTAELVKLSVTGTLVHASQPIAVGSVWPIELEVPSETVRLTGRVVSAQPLATSEDATRNGSGSPQGFAVALAFVKPTKGARLSLERVCRKYAGAETGH
jgi:CheY-like chemotaxis protein